jgi:hypothetical protein
MWQSSDHGQRGESIVSFMLIDGIKFNLMFTDSG